MTSAEILGVCEHAGFVKAADFNNDQRVDILYSGVATLCGGTCQPQFLIYVVTDGQFGYSDITKTAFPSNIRGLYQGAVDVGDFNGDSYADIVVSGSLDLNAKSRAFWLLRNRAQENVSFVDSTSLMIPAPTAFDEGAVRFLDYNMDSRQDILFSGTISLTKFNETYSKRVGKVSAYTQLPNGSFVDQTFTIFSDATTLVLLGGLYVSMFEVFDFNLDSRPDLLVMGIAPNNIPISLLLNNTGEPATLFRKSSGSLQMYPFNVGLGVIFGDIESADLNGDGYPDLALQGTITAQISTSVSVVLFNNQAGGFVPTFQPNLPAQAFYGSIELVDLDGDNATDLLYTARVADSLQPTSGTGLALRNENGTGTFVPFPNLGNMLPKSYISSIDAVVLNSFGTRLVLVFSAGFLPDNSIVLFGHFSLFRVESEATAYSDISTNAFPKYISNIDSAGALVYDYNGDGSADILVAGLVRRQFAKTSLFLGFPNGTFAGPVNGVFPSGFDLKLFDLAAVAYDVDNDGDLDLFISGATKYAADGSYGESHLLLLTGSVYKETAIPATASALFSLGSAFGDLDGDGSLELLLSGNAGNYTYKAVAISLISKAPNMTWVDVSAQVFPAGFVPMYTPQFVLVDLDLNGRLDFVCSGMAYSFLKKPYDPLRPYLFSGRLSVYRNPGNGSMQDLSSSSLPALPNIGWGDLTVADYTGDGLADMFYTGALDTFDAVRYLFKNMGNFSFADQIPLLSVEIKGSIFSRNHNHLIDLNRDGSVDLWISGLEIVNDSYVSVRQLLQNQGNGTFSDATAQMGLSGIPSPQNGAVVFGDFNNDGKLDVVQFGAMSCPPSTFLFERSSISQVLGDGGSTTLGASASANSASSDDGNSAALIAGLASGGIGALLLAFCGFSILLLCCIVLMVLAMGLICAICIIVLAGALLFAIILMAVGTSSTLYKMRSASSSTSTSGMHHSSASIWTAGGGTTAHLSAETTVLDLQSLLGLKNMSELPFPIISKEDLKLKECVGEGSFGKVYRADWNGVEVAVKSLPNISSPLALKDFLNEAAVATKVSFHQNVARFMGAVVTPGSLALVTQYYPNGALDLYLQRNALEWTPRLRIATQVGSAIAFLHSQGVVHRDIAARNVLLGMRLQAYVTDFGIARTFVEAEIGGEDEQTQTTKSTVGPVRWMAPESLAGREFSRKSDVYSFGIFLYEVASNGKVPYDEMPGIGEVIVGVVHNKLRPPIPPDTPHELAELMQQCWAPVKEDRPRMSKVVRRLGRMLGSEEGYENNFDEDSSFEHSSVTHSQQGYTDLLPTDDPAQAAHAYGNLTDVVDDSVGGKASLRKSGGGEDGVSKRRRSSSSKMTSVPSMYGQINDVKMAETTGTEDPDLPSIVSGRGVAENGPDTSRSDKSTPHRSSLSSSNEGVYSTLDAVSVGDAASSPKRKHKQRSKHKRSRHHDQQAEVQQQG